MVVDALYPMRFAGAIVFVLLGNWEEKMAEKSFSLQSTNGAQVKIGNYVLGETLGSGTFGKVKGNRRFQSFDRWNRRISTPGTAGSLVHLCHAPWALRFSCDFTEYSLKFRENKS